MRRYNIIAIVLFLAASSCQRNQTVITGHLDGGERTHITFERLNVNRTELIDSVKVDNQGSFKLKFRPESTELYTLKNERGQIVNLMLAPGDRVHVKTSASSFGRDYEVEGSEESENVRLLVKHMQKTRTVLDSLEQLADSIQDPGNPRLDIIRTAYAQAIIRQKRHNIRYLVEHMNDLSSVYALYQKYDNNNLVLGDPNDLQYFKVVADSLSVSHPNSTLTRSLQSDISRRETEYVQQQQLNTLLEMAEDETGFLELNIPDREGNKIALSSLKGNVILVVFWASGHEASIEALLRLKSTYDRYHGMGFEVYAVSLDNNKIDWMKAIDFNEFNWINVSELSFPDSRASLLYNIKGLPASFLINRSGDIVARNLYGRTLETWLDNLL